jgi:thymidylate synthase (FAD)
VNLAKEEGEEKQLSYDVEVKLLAITPESENLIETAGRLCYNSVEKIGKNESWIQGRIKAGHHSILEHSSATFYIKASRVFSHEICRHRIASISQRSQRYVKENEPSYIIPQEIKDAGLEKHFIFQMNEAWESYRYLLSKGMKPEIARYVLPNACMTEIICTWNFREIRHIIQLRSSKAALPEMQEVANEIKEIMKVKASKVFGDL